MRADAEARSLHIIEAETGRALFEAVQVASSPWQRLRGLLGRRPLERGEALWLAPCNGVHTFFLHYPIAVWVLDRDGVVLEVRHSVPPYRVILPVERGHITVEMRPEESRSAGIARGHRVRLAGR